LAKTLKKELGMKVCLISHHAKHTYEVWSYTQTLIYLPNIVDHIAERITQRKEEKQLYLFVISTSKMKHNYKPDARYIQKTLVPF
jgi:hypothetical protein